MSSTVIIGSGEIGRAIESLLGRRGVQATILDKDTEATQAETSIKGAAFVFLCVPASAVREVLEEYAHLLPDSCILVCLSKGLEAETGMTMDQILDEHDIRDFVLLYGPMLAEELFSGLGGAAVAASASLRARDTVKSLFAGTGLHVETSAEVRAVAYLGVLKNIYAVGLGIASGLGYQWNISGFLISRAVKEMQEILPVLGGSTDTSLSPAGVGDLVATGLSADSLNHSNGIELARGEAVSKLGEGLSSINALIRTLEKAGKLPLLSAIHQISLGRPAKEEFDKMLNS